MPQLADKIREKYPDQYDDMDDAALESAVLAKYPDYQDLVEEPPPTTLSGVPERTQGLLSNITESLFSTPEFVSKGFDWLRDTKIGDTPIAGLIPGAGLNIPYGGEDHYPILAALEAMATPGDVALMAGTGGAGMLPKVGRGIQKVAGLLLAGRGGEQILTAEDPTDVGVGLLKAVGGVAGFRGPRAGRAAGIVDDIPLPTEVVESLTPQARLLQVLKEAKPLNKQQQELYRIERAKRVGKASDIRVTDEASAAEFQSKFKGEYPKVDFEEIRTKLSQDDVTQLFKQIGQHPDLLPFEQLRAQTALWKVLDKGIVPQPSEIDVLNRAFGENFTAALQANLPKIDKAKSLLAEAVNLPRGIMASFDLSAPFRQGLGLIHKKEFYTSFDDMFRALGSEKGYEGVMEAVKASPSYALARTPKSTIKNITAESRGRLALTDLTRLSSREEAIMSTWAESGGNIPGVSAAYRATIGRGVRATNRAYVGFLNKLRMDTFNSLVQNAKKMDPNVEQNGPLLDAIAEFVNVATGRGDLGMLEKHAVLLNSTLFSPRLIASRMQTLNPNYYLKIGNNPMRKEKIKSLIAIGSFGTILGQLARTAGATVGDDPTDSDFGKIRVNDTRIDPWGGYQQYVVAASRFGSYGKDFATDNLDDYGPYQQPTGADVLGRFMRNKEHPAVSFAHDMLTGTNAIGEPFTIGQGVAERFIPMLIQDIMEIMQEDPGMLPAAIPGALGMGVQTYPDR